MIDERIDIRNAEKVKEAINIAKPKIVFHLAAQPLVRHSYSDPLGTWSTNVMGTANLLEACRQQPSVRAVIIVTSDKCYENVEWVFGYKETDHLGGKDIYSGSKGAAEVIFHAYYNSFFKNPKNKIRLATGRAGNVIGGGDWAKDRIVVDCMKNWADGKIVELRSPEATRPWQHVLEPLSGYLTLGSQLNSDARLLGESFNFGPRSEQNRTVLELLTDLSQQWNFNKAEDAYSVTDNIPFHEAGLLKLNCDKALFNLRWEANLSYKECVKMVGEWYYSFYKMEKDMYKLTLDQITQYEDLAMKRDLIWNQI
jgi:CDP-glucose 4,6-dehydratase